MKPWHVVWDIEGNNLLNSSSIDYTTVPYKLKDNFKFHCIVADVVVNEKRYIYAFYDGDKYILDGREHCEEIDGVLYQLKDYEPQDYIHKPMSEFKKFVEALPENSVVVGHNIINFDLLAVKLHLGIDYEVERDMSMSSELGDDYWGGKKVVFDDTMIRAKTLNPDRLGGQSLDNLSSKGTVQKVAFRKNISEAERFKHFAADMLYYCIFDVKSNRQVASMLDIEQEAFGWGDKWNSAIKLEKAVAELITRQEHRGFKFDMALAQKNLEELDKMMLERKEKIEKIIPPRPATKAVQKDSTPPKLQFKANGEPSANLLKFAVKMNAEIKDGKFIYNGVSYDLPLAPEPFIKEMPATVDDTTHIKNWLVGLGWVPSEYKEKDITKDLKTKTSLPPDRLQAAIERYVEQTVSMNFKKDRCEHLEIWDSEDFDEKECAKILYRVFARRLERKGGIKVKTNPSFTMGQEKEICPNLQALAESSEELACITDIVEYLTYRHRRNSILGGGADWDEDEEPEKGFLASVRDDGRIPTPADTCGAATSRMKHRSVANIPRVTSLYGWEMRSLFGVDDSCYQIGYDFDSLEARQEANFCWPFESGNRDYCHSLLLDKPNDVHTKMAEKISEVLKKAFSRGSAKAVKYGATYGAQAAKIAKTIGSDLATGTLVFDAFWNAALPLKKLKEALNMEWMNFDKKRIVGIDGRLIPTRSAHAILNSKFQSAGVICAKRTMVLHDRKLAQHNLRVDFFKDDWTNREFAQQLIAYHK